MNILVCIKQVPDTREIRIDPETGTMIRKGVPSIINPDDLHALEYALTLKDQDPDTHVVVLSMGPLQAKEALIECLCMGADQAILLSDRAFGGADTWATANTLAAAVRRLQPFDLILCGQQAIDGDTAQVGPQLAERLAIPQITYAQSVRLENHSVQVERQMEDGYQLVKADLPVLITATRKLNQPRYMNIRDIVKIHQADDPVQVWGLEDLDLDPGQVGLKGSPTRVKRSFSPAASSEVRFFSGTADEMAASLIDSFRTLNLIEK
jgi:electron transfer flavoprotein beta subunit